jgi:hypothetical protein
VKRLLSALICLACTLPVAVMAAPAAVAMSLDEAKLRVLSCDVSAPSSPESGKAVDWLNRSARKTPREGGQRLAGPIELGKACLKNVTLSAGPGAVVIQGEICNARLEDFTDALAAAGTRLRKDVETKMPGVVLGEVTEERQYLITEGMIDMETGQAVPISGRYAFACGASEGSAR